MAATEQETLAGFELLVAIAKADGTIQSEERTALEAALGGVQLPAGATLAALIEQRTDLDGILARIVSPEARDAAFQGAYAMANADGVCTPEEQQILDQLRTAWSIPEEKVTFMKRLLDETKDTVLPSNIPAMGDPIARAKEVQSDVLKYSVLSAVLGAFPVPGLAIFTDLAVVALQIKLVRDIGQRYGHTMDKKAAASLLGSVGVGAGARIAVNNIAKLIPGFGSVVGAATSFASTWAVGKMGVAYFDNDGKVDADFLKKVFTTAQKEGKDQYKAHKGEIDAKKAATQSQIEALAAKRKAGEITEEEYQRQLDKLA